MGEGECEAACTVAADCAGEAQQPAYRRAVERLRMGSLAGMWDVSPLEKLLVSQLIKFTEMDEIFKVHCQLYSIFPRQFIGLSQINPLYSLLPDPLKPPFNIRLPSTSSSCMWHLHFSTSKHTGRFIMFSGITKICYMKTVGHVFTKPVQIEGTTNPPPLPSKLFFIVVHISIAR